MPTLQEIKKRQQYITKANQTEEKYGLPKNLLVGVMGAESNFNPNAVSPVGAKGLMQFMKATAQEYGINPLNPSESIDAAGKYLASSYKKFGNWEDALRSYNMGVGGLQKVKAGKMDMPKETQDYVGRVYKNAGIKYDEPSYANSVAPYMNQIVTPTVNNLQIPQQTTTFASVPDSAEKETKTEDKEVTAVEEKTKEYNFLDELNKIQQTEYSFLKPKQAQQIEAPQTDYMQQYEQISQFVENPQVAQQGKRFKLQDERNKVQKDNTIVAPKQSNKKELRNIILDDIELAKTMEIKSPRAEANKIEKSLPNKETVDFFNKVKEEAGADYFTALLKIQNENGNPKINVGTSKGLPFSARRNYNPFTNEVNIPKGLTIEDDIENYIKEVSHAGQPTINVAGKFIANDIPGYIKASTSSGKEIDNLNKYVYDNPNTVEFYTHNIVQPKLMKQVEDFSAFDYQNVENKQQGGGINQFKKKPFQLQDERNSVVRDDTPNTKRDLSLMLAEYNNAKKDEQELRATGQIKNPNSIQYRRNVRTQPDIKQDNISTEQRNAPLNPLQRPLIYLANPEKVLGDLGVPNMETSELDRQAINRNRFNPYQSGTDRFLNNAKIGLGYIPEATVNTALAAAFMPEGSGALGLVNEALNPLAGIGDLVNSLGNKYLPNAYKLNPNAFKPDLEAYYRMLGDKGFEDAKLVGELRPAQRDNPFSEVYYSKGKLFEDYGNTNMAEVKNTVMNHQPLGYPFPVDDYAVSVGNIKLDNPNVSIYKKDWLQGYKQIEVPKSNLNHSSTFDEEGISDFMQILKNKKEADKAIEMAKSDLTDPETIRRASELGIDPELLQQASNNMTYTTQNSTPSSFSSGDFTININPKQIGRSVKQEMVAEIMGDLSPNFTANEIAAHEIGHVFQNTPLWKEGYKKTAPNDIKKLLSFDTAEEAKKLRGYWENYSTRDAAPTRVDELLGNIDFKEGVGKGSYADKNRSYFENASNRYGTNVDNKIERLPMFREYRQGMRDSGVLKNKWDEITPEMIDEYAKIKPENRINSFMEFSDKNKELLRQASRIAPATLPIAGASYLATQENKQQGGTAEQKDQEWLKNWYENRVIPNKDIQGAYLKDKPIYTERLKNIPPVTKVDMIDNNPQKTGQYNENTGELLLTPRAQPSVYTHEVNHYLNQFPSTMRTVHENVVEQNMYKKGDPRLGANNEHYDYLRNPDEIHSRVQVLRKDAGFKPDEEVTQEKLLEYLQNYKGDDENILQLMNLTDENGLLEMLNYMADAPKNKEKQYVAQQGGNFTENELAFLSEIAIKDNNGQRSHPNKVTKIEGDVMATDGYGDIPLYVIPNKGKPKVVNANTGQHKFKGATEFIEIPLFKK